MRLRIDKIWFIVVALVLSVPSAHAQIVTANPLEWMALAEGNEAINGEIEKEIKGQTKTALLQNTIAAEFTKIHEWEKNDPVMAMLSYSIFGADQEQVGGTANIVSEAVAKLHRDYPE